MQPGVTKPFFIFVHRFLGKFPKRIESPFDRDTPQVSGCKTRRRPRARNSNTPPAMRFSAVISPIPVRSGTNPSLTQSSPARMKKQVMRHTYRRTRHRIGPKAAIARTGKQLPANARRKHVPWPIRHSKSPGAEAHGALCLIRSTGAFCHSDPHCGPKPEYPPGDYLCTVNQRPEIDGSTLSTSCPSAPDTRST